MEIAMANNLFDIIGDGFFKPLTSKNRRIYMDCLNIIYDSYKYELSYGADREDIITNLIDYFDSTETDIIYDLEEDIDNVGDSRRKATMFLRNLKMYGWLDSDITYNQKERITMPSHAIQMMGLFAGITNKNEAEYSNDIYSIYSLLKNTELQNSPYQQIIQPVQERTANLFSSLKALNTNIKDFIDELTTGKDLNDFFDNFSAYYSDIGSGAYKRLKTTDNISKFRNAIKTQLHIYLSNEELLEKTILDYQQRKNVVDYEEARDAVTNEIQALLNEFYQYDDIIAEIDKKHAKYNANAVERARFLLSSSSNIDSKISKILQMMSLDFNRSKEKNLNIDIDEKTGEIFNLYTQQFINEESLSPIKISKQITDIDDIEDNYLLDIELREEMERELNKNLQNSFSHKNINMFVSDLLKDMKTVSASEVMLANKRDAIRLICVEFYGWNDKSDYAIKEKDNYVETEYITFKDFEIFRRER